MKSSRLEKNKINEDTIIKDVKNLFRLNKEIDDATSKEKINRFRLKEENEAIKDKVVEDVRNLSEHKEENQYKPVRVGNVLENNFIEYESNNYRNKILSIEKYLNKIGPYLPDIINDYKKPDIWKTQLTINLISYKDNDKECVSIQRVIVQNS